VCISTLADELLPYHSHSFFLSFSSFEYSLGLVTFPPLLVVEKRGGGEDSGATEG